MNLPWRDPCSEHRDVLHDFVDRRAGYDPGAGPDVTAALDHLERCRDCELELGTTALVVAALRRMADEVRAAEPSPDAWNRLATRIEPVRTRRALLGSPLAGLAVSAGLVLALLAPLGLELAPRSEIAAIPTAEPAALLEEERWLRERSQGSRPAGQDDPAPVRPETTPAERLGPDGVVIGTFWVRTAAPTGRQL